MRLGQFQAEMRWVKVGFWVDEFILSDWVVFRIDLSSIFRLGSVCTWPVVHVQDYQYPSNSVEKKTFRDTMPCRSTNIAETDNKTEKRNF